MKRTVNQEKLIRQLTQLGYKVSKRVPTVKKTFEVETDKLERFVKTQKARGIKLKEAVDEALDLYLQKYGKSGR